MGKVMRLAPFVRTFKKLWDDESGQSTTEYILILVVVVAIALKFKEKIGQKIESATDTLGTRIDDALKE